MKKLVIGIVLIAGLSAAWFFVSPLFIDQPVDESLPDLHQLSRADIDAMSDAERASVREAMREFSATAPDAPMSEPMADAPAPVAQGTFRDADAIHRGEGTAALYDAGNQKLLRLEDFRVTNGPALIVLLSPAVSPRSAQDVMDAGYVSLGKLKGNVGNQNYAIPSDADLSLFGSVVIWCELFDVLFSAADLAIVPRAANGEARLTPVGDLEVWSDAQRAWLKPEAFWLAYAETRGGLTFGRRTDYPPYDTVKEFDTLLIETEQGPCLMEFFHDRWRRANDVRRWNDRFSDFGGCPYVFE